MPDRSFSGIYVVLMGIIGAIFILGFFCNPESVRAQSKSLRENGLSGKSFVETSKGIWNITAKQITYDRKNNTYVAEGNVKITSGDRSIEGNWVKLDAKNHRAELKGNVFLKYGRDWLKGDHVFWNLEDETGKVDGGMVYFAENHFYINGKVIEKTGPNEYVLTDGYLTTCSPEKPDWSIRYKKMKVDTEGIAWAKHTSFWVRKFPLLYSPIVAMPVDQDRQSGFLMPWVGASKLNGYQGELPFFWAIRRDMDATFYGRYMEKRGWMSGIEYRIANNTWGEGVWMFNYLWDQADEKHLADEGYPFQQKDRYWLRARHKFDLPYGIEGRLDLDVASDQNYLKEFKTGSTAYSYTNDIFKKFYGRGILNDETISARESSLYMTQRRESRLLFLDAIYWDQLDRSIDEFTLQRLPELGFDITPSWIDGFPLYYDLQTSGVNFWRREGDKGYRLDVFPRLHLPLHWNNYFDFEPSIGIRSTSYYIDWQEDDSPGSWQQRTLADVTMELSSRLNRTYNMNWGDIVAVQHAVRPQVKYEYMPKVDQSDLPGFDLVDNIEERHGITYGISNFLTAKRVHKDEQGNEVTSYHEVARLQVLQTYNIRKASSSQFEFSSIASSDESDELEAEKKRFSPVGVLLDVMPGRWVTLTYDARFSVEGGTIDKQELYATLDSGYGQILRVSYEFLNDTAIDELIVQTDLKVLPNVFLSTYHDYSFDKAELFKQGYGFRYQHGCWGVGLRYEKEGEDQRFAFSIDLLGLGHIARGF